MRHCHDGHGQSHLQQHQHDMCFVATKYCGMIQRDIWMPTYGWVIIKFLVADYNFFFYCIWLLNYSGM